MMSLRKMLWMGMCMLSLAGCQSRKQCVECCECTPCCDMPTQTVVVTQPKPDPVVTTSASPINQGMSEEESEPAGNIALNAVAPGAGPYDGQTSGTVVFTPREAKKLGITPGVTPTALWVPGQADSEMIAHH